MPRQRVAENLNQALHALLDRDPTAYLLGEDVVDPYGGAFKITRGLSSRHPERVIATPVSESGIVGAAAGLALAGDTAVVEIMFGDFLTLAMDPLLNFASKSVSMYGRRIPLRLVVRCPVGGGRGYGPTHSQSPQKHLIGVPGLSLYELSPLHDSGQVLEAMLRAAEPAVLFEDKLLYPRPMFQDGVVDDLFGYRACGGDLVEVALAEPAPVDCVLIAAGGSVERALTAMRALLLTAEITCRLLVPSRLYPLDLRPAAPLLRSTSLVCVVEESTAGGTWGAEVAHQLHQQGWHPPGRPVQLVHSAASVIPAASHLERAVLVQADTIERRVREALG